MNRFILILFFIFLSLGSPNSYSNLTCNPQIQRVHDHISVIETNDATEAARLRKLIPQNPSDTFKSFLSSIKRNDDLPDALRFFSKVSSNDPTVLNKFIKNFSHLDLPLQADILKFGNNFDSDVFKFVAKFDPENVPQHRGFLNKFFMNLETLNKIPDSSLNRYIFDLTKNEDLNVVEFTAKFNDLMNKVQASGLKSKTFIKGTVETSYAEYFTTKFLKPFIDGCVPNVSQCPKASNLSQHLNRFADAYQRNQRLSATTINRLSENLAKACAGSLSDCGKIAEDFQTRLGNYPDDETINRQQILGKPVDGNPSQRELIDHLLTHEMLDHRSILNQQGGFTQFLDRLNHDINGLSQQSQRFNRYNRRVPASYTGRPVPPDKINNSRRAYRPKFQNTESIQGSQHWQRSRPGSADSLHHGGTKFNNEPLHGHANFTELPCHRPRPSLCKGENSPFIEYDVGLPDGWTAGDPRGAARVVINKQTGEMYLTLDHYKTFYYLEGRNGYKNVPKLWRNKSSIDPSNLPPGIRVLQ